MPHVRVGTFGMTCAAGEMDCERGVSVAQEVRRETQSTVSRARNRGYRRLAPGPDVSLRFCTGAFSGHETGEPAARRARPCRCHSIPSSEVVKKCPFSTSECTFYREAAHAKTRRREGSMDVHCASSRLRVFA